MLIGPFAGGGHDLIGPWNVYGTDREAVDLVTAVRETLPDATLDDGSDRLRRRLRGPYQGREEP